MIKLSNFNNINKGQIGVIIGNGPSLKTVPRELLDKYKTFGSNEIFLAYTEPEEAPKNLRGFISHYYCAINPLVIEQNIEEIKSYPAKAKFIRGDMLDGPDIAQIRSSGYGGFYTNPLYGLYEGYTVTYIMLQLAYYMGFSKILLVGIDHYYKYIGEPNEQNTRVKPDVNHFHPKYFKGKSWNNPDLNKSYQAYQLAQRAYTASGREVINLTPGTKLDVFPTGDYKDYLEGPK